MVTKLLNNGRVQQKKDVILPSHKRTGWMGQRTVTYIKDPLPHPHGKTYFSALGGKFKHTLLSLTGSPRYTNYCQYTKAQFHKANAEWFQKNCGAINTAVEGDSPVCVKTIEGYKPLEEMAVVNKKKVQTEGVFVGNLDTAFEVSAFPTSKDAIKTAFSGEAQRNIWLAIANAIIDTTIEQATGVLAIVRNLFKALVAGCVKGWVNQALLVDLTTAIIAEIVLMMLTNPLLLSLSIPTYLFTTNAFKVGFRTALRFVVNRYYHDKAYSVTSKETYIEGMKGFAKGFSRDGVTWFLGKGFISDICTTPLAAILVVLVAPTVVRGD